LSNEEIKEDSRRETCYNKGYEVDFTLTDDTTLIEEDNDLILKAPDQTDQSLPE